MVIFLWKNKSFSLQLDIITPVVQSKDWNEFNVDCDRRQKLVRYVNSGRQLIKL
jgi:hypothetical protein